MEPGKHGHHGPLVKVIVRGQDPEDVVILHQQMEERHVQVQDKSQSLVQTVNVS